MGWECGGRIDGESCLILAPGSGGSNGDFISASSSASGQIFVKVVLAGILGCANGEGALACSPLLFKAHTG